MPLNIAILGAGPAGLTLALALTKRHEDISFTIFERSPSHFEVPTYNPDRSYTIDITGHGIKAAKYVHMLDRFDAELIEFKGIINCFSLPLLGLVESRIPSNGWTGSRGDICSGLLKELISRMTADTSSRIHFDSNVTSLNITIGELTVDHMCGEGLNTRKYTFDLIVGSDGGGSMARTALQMQIPEFTVDSFSIPNHSRMIHMDNNNVEKMDPGYLYIMSYPPLLGVAGAINGEKGRDNSPPKWFCQFTTVGPKTYASIDEARHHLASSAPLVFNCVSEKSLKSFISCESLPTGKSKVCSSFVGGRVVLLGDSAAPFPPVGQGLNAAMESAMVLDQCIGRALRSSSAEEMSLIVAANEYNGLWRCEASAMRTIAQQLDLRSLLTPVRVLVYNWFGCSAIQNAKSEVMSYSAASWRQILLERVLMVTTFAIAGLVTARSISHKP